MSLDENLGKEASWPDAWSALYDQIDVDRQPHISFYSALVGRKTTSILDLGCGTGSITVKIAQSMAPGGRVTGVDLAPKMIEIAQQRAPEHEWLLGDICDPKVEGQFDLIVIMFHTLQMLLEDRQLHQAFSSISALLAPEGRFAFDIYQPNEAWLAAVDPAPVVAREYTDASGERIEVLESNGEYSRQSKILSGEWRLRHKQTGRMLALEPIVQRVRQFYPSDIEAAAAQSGMTIYARFGELDLSPLTAKSKRQVYICKKA